MQLFSLTRFTSQKGSAMGTSKFPLGQVVITANAKDQLYPADVPLALNRHASGDWGDVGEQDGHENEISLAQNLRLFSVYLVKRKETH
jgi:hypothetical protein